MEDKPKSNSPFERNVALGDFLASYLQIFLFFHNSSTGFQTLLVFFCGTHFALLSLPDTIFHLFNPVMV